MRFIRTAFRWLWNILKFSHTLVFGTLALILLIFLFINPFAKEPITVPKDSALAVYLEGRVVEQLTSVDPFEAAFGGPSAVPREVLLSDILEAMDRASSDKRIKMMYLRLDQFEGALPGALHQLVNGIRSFKESGKTVAAYGNAYSQAQYLLAAQADHVFMNPYGGTLITGYGAYPLYFAEALEKLKLSTHVYKVGTYKSAIEPIIRNDMSEADREAKTAFLNALWDAYREDVHAARGDKGVNLSADYNEVPELLRSAGGDLAQLALNMGLVDELKSRDEMSDWLVDQVGSGRNGNGFNGIAMETYLKATKPLPLGGPENKIAVIYAVGTIMDGEQPAGTVGGETLANLIRSARLNDDVKAIVLRVDSPGGSAFASEIIRRELERAQEDGKPVIASMGSLAASGGYWISSTADEIWAEPTTITGSIGIFGVLLTAENAMDSLGIHSDGVGTTSLSGGYSPTRPMNPLIADIIQQSIENGYEKFINLVARGRDMTPEAVDAIGQGRVWDGVKAHELGLVDHLGSLDQAIKAAAERAGVENYKKIVVQEEPSALDLFLRELADNLSIHMGQYHSSKTSVEGELIRVVREQLALPFTLNDPNHVYAVCMECLAFTDTQTN
jgi:protease-4